MKKSKLVVSIISLCFALAVLTFGVFAAQQVSYQLSGNISYEVSDAFVEIETKIYSHASVMDEYDMCDKIDEIVAGDYSGLSLQSSVEKYSSLTNTGLTNNTGVSLTFENEKYTYFFVITVKNLSKAVNVWAVTQDTLTSPTNTKTYSNDVVLDIYSATSTSQGVIVIAVGIDDVTQNIGTTAFSYGIKVGVGDLSQQDFNIAKLNASQLAAGKAAKANNSIAGVVVIPATYNSVDITEIASGAFNSASNIRTLATAKDSNGNYKLNKVHFYALNGCTKLKNIYLPDNLQQSLRTGNDWGDQAGVSNTAFVKVKAGISYTPDTYTFSDGVLTISSLQAKTINYEYDGDNYSETHAEWFIDGISWLVNEIEIADSVSTSTFYGMLNGMSGLKKFEIPSRITTLHRFVTTIYYNSLEHLDLIIPSTVTTFTIDGDNYAGLLYYAFCNSVTIYSNANFKGCSYAAKKLYIMGNCTISTWCTGGDYGDNYIEYLYLGSGVTTTNWFGDGALRKLQTIEVSPENTVFKSDNNCVIEKATNKLVKGCINSVIPSYVTEIGSYSFAWNTDDTLTIVIPNSVTKICDYAFSASYTPDPNYLNISFASGSTLQEIGSGALGGNDTYLSNTTLTIPASVTKIGTGIFNMWSSVTNVVFETQSYWWITKNKTSYTAIDVSNSATNANNFNRASSAYSNPGLRDHYWKRTDTNVAPTSW